MSFWKFGEISILQLRLWCSKLCAHQKREHKYDNRSESAVIISQPQMCLYIYCVTILELPMLFMIMIQSYIIAEFRAGVRKWTRIVNNMFRQLNKNKLGNPVQNIVIPN